jgi:photosystem II stability/assembly factor-like uncharacterized protein
VRATPYGGAVVTLAQSPVSPQTLYAFDSPASPGGLFVSQDGGASWTPRAGLAVPPEQIRELTADAGDRRVVYARLTAPGLLRTLDGGRHWSAIGPAERYVAALLAEAPGALLAGTEDGLFRSTDRGDTWSPAGLDGEAVVALARDPRTPSTLLAAVAPPEEQTAFTLWKSTDGGATWAQLATADMQRPDAIAVRFAFAPAQPGVLYLDILDVSDIGALFRSTDGGAAWTLLPAALGIRALAVAPDGTLVAGTGFGIARSADRGDTWSPALPLDPLHSAPPQDAIGGLLVTPAGALLAYGSSGLWRSIDNGASWQSSDQGMVALSGFSVAVAPAGPEVVLASAGSGQPGGNAIFRSADQGASWARLFSSLSYDFPITALTFDPRAPRHVDGLGSDGQADFLVESRDRGRTWRRVPLPYACGGGDSICSVTIDTLAVDPGDPDVLFLAGLFFFHFGGNGPFLLRSDDGGVTWQDIAKPPGIETLAVAPGPPRAVYGLTCGGLVRSTNRGKTWRMTGAGLPALSCGNGLPDGLAVDPVDPRRLYVATKTQGVYVSTDAGATFRAMNRGLVTGGVATILIDPTDRNHLFAGVAGKGVFHWQATLGRWAPLNDGLPAALFQGVLALDPRHPSLLYAGTINQGIFRLDLGGGGGQ